MGKRSKDRTPSARAARRRTIAFRSVIGLFLAGALLPYLFPGKAPSLPGVSVTGPMRPVDPDACRLLLDVTAFDPQPQERVFSHEIFDEILAMIDEAHSFIVLDFFLWNSWQGEIPESHRPLSAELAEALIRKKARSPDLLILAMSDPINRIYGTDEEPFFREMAAAGIPVVFTDVDRLPASNMGYTPWARAYLEPFSRWPGVRQWFDRRAVANVFDHEGPLLTRRQLMNLLHFRANHRKVIVVDRAEGPPRVLAPSLNPADGSSAHSNIGLRVEGPVALDALATVVQCATWSAANPHRVLEAEPGQARTVLAALGDRVPSGPQPEEPGPEDPAVQWLTEGAIVARILQMLDEAGPGDHVDAALFYLSDRAVVDALADAARRGARVRLILDANRDAFGRRKNGVPNRPVAAELLRRTRREGLLEIRWADTHGEQFHGKTLSVSDPASGGCRFLCGSANWTRRNLQDLNLESALYLRNVPSVTREFAEAFDLWWTNDGTLRYTLDYAAMREQGWSLRWKTWQYRIQERTGMSTF